MPDLLDRLQQQIDALVRHGHLASGDRRLTRKWATHARDGLDALVDGEGRLRREAIVNFRRDQVLLHDLPAADLRGSPVRNGLIGWRRGTRRCLLQCRDILRERGYDDLLRRYPCPEAGRPHLFAHAGSVYTFRWARHVYFLGLLRQVLGGALGEDPVVLDIGGGDGTFSALLRLALPRSRHVVIDLPEQLIGAHYLLASAFPGARIAGPGDALGLGPITRSCVGSHDFVLLPASCLDRLAAGSIDLVVNFGSFGEMSRRYFDAYFRSPAVRSARYLLMANRIAAVPERYHNDITILDYPIWDAGRRLHFDVCPIYSVDFLVSRAGPFGYRLGTPDPHFEYVGRIGDYASAGPLSSTTLPSGSVT